MSSVLGRGWRAYLALLNRRPLATQMAQTCVVMGTGDLIAQTMIEKRLSPSKADGTRQGLDYARTMRFMGLGLVFVVSFLETLKHYEI